ncbi:MAG: hypothetical protein HRF40_05430 [Nitrososphaera sp.]
MIEDRIGFPHHVSASLCVCPLVLARPNHSDDGDSGNCADMFCSGSPGDWAITKAVVERRLRRQHRELQRW